jgi:hypothetical protein
MNDNIFDKIQVITIIDTGDKLLPSTNKTEFFNASVTLSGDYIIINTHDLTNKRKYESTPYHLSKVKGYRTL